MNVRDQLLEAAARVYAEAGYRGATTRRIALAAGVNEITLFRQFGSKDALMREAIERCRQDATVPLPQEPVDPVRELTDFARAHLARMRERRSFIRTCMGEFEEHPEIMEPENSPPAVAAKSLGAYLGRLRERRVTTAEFDECVAATMLMGVIFADAMGRDIMRDMFPRDPEDTLPEYVRIFLRGLGVSV
ncbi:MAG: TetR/AcrR family transcriptional regulator [Gemmatimonadales bacterium]|nr:TetR/AcrR family transcriptional regulator [Gemmatimonadales bacterium]MBA3554763.1 TetR/AcrR family transcriptional regulator [Gemmatimonadales bacterium]